MHGNGDRAAMSFHVLDLHSSFSSEGQQSPPTLCWCWWRGSCAPFPSSSSKAPSQLIYPACCQLLTDSSILIATRFFAAGSSGIFFYCTESSLDLRGKILLQEPPFAHSWCEVVNVAVYYKFSVLPLEPCCAMI